MLGLSRFTMSPSLQQRSDAIGRVKEMDINGKKDDPFFVQVMRYVNDVMATRNIELRVYEDFFEGGDRQKIYFRRYKGESDESYNARIDKSVAVNKCRRIVKKGAQALYATPPERRMEDDKAHQRMMEVWDYNKVRSGYFHLNLATDIGTYGFQVVHSKYIRKDNRVPVTAKSGLSVGNEVEYIPLHPALTIPIPRPNKQNEMGAVIVLTMDIQEDPMMAVELPQVRWIDFVDDERWLRWRVDFSPDGSKMSGEPVDVSFGPGFVNRNPYNNVNIPFTLYRNPGGSQFVLDGSSDLVDAIEPQNKYNETTSDDGHVIAQHTFPILLFTGMTMDKNYARGVADVHSTRNNEADAKYVTWDANLDASANYSKRLEADMREASGYSPVSDGRLENIGQVRNLRGAMVPDILTITEKQAFFREAEKDQAVSSLAMIEWHEGAEYANKELEITFSDDYIPVDELTRVESQSLALKAGLESLKDVIRKRHPELETEEEVDAKIAETLEIMTLVSETQQKKTEPVAEPVDPAAKQKTNTE